MPDLYITILPHGSLSVCRCYQTKTLHLQGERVSEQCWRDLTVLIIRGRDEPVVCGVTQVPFRSQFSTSAAPGHGTRGNADYIATTGARPS
jgi:hypothetical protein